MATHRKQKVIAKAYDKRGRLLAVGENSYIKTHPLQAEFAEKAGNSLAIYLHAEIDALIKAKGPVYKLSVERRLADGTLGNAEPCKICKLAIERAAVQVVEYSTGSKV